MTRQSVTTSVHAARTPKHTAATTLAVALLPLPISANARPFERFYCPVGASPSPKAATKLTKKHKLAELQRAHRTLPLPQKPSLAGRLAERKQDQHGQRGAALLA